MNYAKIRKFDVTNGPGIRVTLFVSGCTHNCKGCFNKEQQDFMYGDIWTKEVESEFLEYVNNSNVIGVNILGGEPMDQTRDNDLLNLLQQIKSETGKNIWLWSGYTFEQIVSDKNKNELLKNVDVLVDGRYIVGLRDIKLKYRGSKNQMVIDIKISFVLNKIIVFI